VKTPFRATLKFLSLSVLILMTACGAPKRAVQTDTDTDLGTDNSTPLFDTTSTTSPTGTATDNLFTTQTGTELTAPTQGSSTLGQLGQAETRCLTNNSSFGLGSYGAAPTATSSQQESVSCLNSSSFGVEPNLLYQGAETSYKTADYCLGEAASTFAPQQGMSQLEIDLSMQMAELSLIRCMRDLVRYQTQLVPWANAQTSAFQHADHNLWYIGQGIRPR
jgi:hypothetical protein